MNISYLSPEAREAIAPFLDGGETVLHSVQSYRMRNGMSGECIALLTSRQVILLERALGEPFQLRRYDRSAITNVRKIQAGLGDEILILLSGDREVERILYSSLDRDQFASFERILLKQDRNREENQEKQNQGEDGTGIPSALEELPAPRVLERKEAKTDELPTLRSLTIQLDRKRYLPGEEVRGSVILMLPKELTVRGIHLSALGFEESRIQVSTGSVTVTHKERQEFYKHEILFFGEKREKSLLRNISTALSYLFGKKVYPKHPAGAFEYPFSFSIPAHALPAYKGAHLFVDYALVGRVDIPMGADLKSKGAVPVSWTSPSFPASRGLYPSEDKSFFDRFRPDIAMDAEVEGGTWAPGEVIRGRLRFKKNVPRNTPRVLLRIMSVEHSKAKKHKRRKKKKWAEKILFFKDPSVESGAIDFEIEIPQSCPPPFQGAHGSLAFSLYAYLEVPWAADIRVEVPLV